MRYRDSNIINTPAKTPGQHVAISLNRQKWRFPPKLKIPTSETQLFCVNHSHAVSFIKKRYNSIIDTTEYILSNSAHFLSINLNALAILRGVSTCTTDVLEREYTLGRTTPEPILPKGDIDNFYAQRLHREYLAMDYDYTWKLLRTLDHDTTHNLRSLVTRQLRF